jgi:hypothetical protein
MLNSNVRDFFLGENRVVDSQLSFVGVSLQMLKLQTTNMKITYTKCWNRQLTMLNTFPYFLYQLSPLSKPLAAFMQHNKAHKCGVQPTWLPRPDSQGFLFKCWNWKVQMSKIQTGNVEMDNWKGWIHFHIFVYHLNPLSKPLAAFMQHSKAHKCGLQPTRLQRPNSQGFSSNFETTNYKCQSNRNKILK